MKKKTIVGLALGVALLAVLGATIIDNNWGVGDDRNQIEYTPPGEDDTYTFEETLNYALFEEYGPLLLVVTLMLFGAIIGAACISKEEEDDDSN